MKKGLDPRNGYLLARTLKKETRKTKSENHFVISDKVLSKIATSCSFISQKLKHGYLIRIFIRHEEWIHSCWNFILELRQYDNDSIRSYIVLALSFLISRLIRIQSLKKSFEYKRPFILEERKLWEFLRRMELDTWSIFPIDWNISNSNLLLRNIVKTIQYQKTTKDHKRPKSPKKTRTKAEKN